MQLGGILYGNSGPSLLSALAFLDATSGNAELFSNETKKGGQAW